MSFRGEAELAVNRRCSFCLRWSGHSAQSAMILLSRPYISTSTSRRRGRTRAPALHRPLLPLLLERRFRFSTLTEHNQRPRMRLRRPANWRGRQRERYVGGRAVRKRRLVLSPGCWRTRRRLIRTLASSAPREDELEGAAAEDLEGAAGDCWWGDVGWLRHDGT